MSNNQNQQQLSDEEKFVRRQYFGSWINHPYTLMLIKELEKTKDLYHQDAELTKDLQFKYESVAAAAAVRSIINKFSKPLV